MTIFTVFFQMLALLIMIGAGFFVAKKGMMDAHTNSQVSAMIVNVFNPMLIISSKTRDLQRRLIRGTGFPRHYGPGGAHRAGHVRILYSGGNASLPVF